MKTTLLLTGITAAVIYMCTPRPNEIIIVNKSNHAIEGSYASIKEEYIRDVITGDFIITDTKDREIPYVITPSKTVLFRVTVNAASKQHYMLKRGTPSHPTQYDTDIDIVADDTLIIGVK